MNLQQMFFLQHGEANGSSEVCLCARELADTAQALNGAGTLAARSTSMATTWERRCLLIRPYCARKTGSIGGPADWPKYLTSLFASPDVADGGDDTARDHGTDAGAEATDYSIQSQPDPRPGGRSHGGYVGAAGRPANHHVRRILH